MICCSPTAAHVRADMAVTVALLQLLFPLVQHFNADAFAFLEAAEVGAVYVSSNLHAVHLLNTLSFA